MKNRRREWGVGERWSTWRDIDRGHREGQKQERQRRESKGDKIQRKREKDTERNRQKDTEKFPF